MNTPRRSAPPLRSSAQRRGDPALSWFVTGSRRVSVPATSANLGPGYDCLGLALDLRDRLEGEVVASGLEVHVDGEGAGDVPYDDRHLVVRAMHATFDALGVRAPGLRLRCTNVVPHGRGLGSSSAAIVGGIVLARALVADGDERLDEIAMLRLANRLEGHPDNVAPALLGGFVVCGQAAGGLDGEEPEVWAVRAPVAAGVGAVVLVPPTGVPTKVARGLLPDSVPHADAAANTGRAALLVASLGGAPATLLRATEDFVHQRYREPAMPESLGLVRRLRAAAVPAVVSGAGPTVLGFTAPGLPLAAEIAAACPDGWAARTLAVDPRGALTET